jgi:carbon-monoxide dehydrogenase medium subunit
MYEFDYIKPQSLQEAQDLIGEDKKLLAGGQTYLPTLRQRLAMPELLIDLNGLDVLKGICEADDRVSIGAMTRHAEVAASALVQDMVPGLAAMAGGIGDPAVRHRGTLGGSLANNDPSACYPAAVLALGATIHTSKRSIEAEDFFQGLFTTALDEDEIITHVTFPAARSAYLKFKQPASGFALAGVFVCLLDGAYRIAVTGAGQDGVFRWHEAEAALNADASFRDFKTLTLAPDMIEDMHADADYRRNLVQVATRRVVEALA